MSLGATVQELITRLTLQDNMSGGLSRATSGVSSAETRVTSLSGKLGGLRSVASGVGGAMSHAASQIGGLASNVGLFAGGAGLLGIGTLLGQSVSKANNFAETVDKLSGITGQSAETISAMTSALDYFGISNQQAITSISMMTKNQALNAQTTKKAEAFQKEYGLSLTDTSGKLKDVNQMLLDSADYYNNKAIPSQTKALALSKLYGRQWASLVEVFEAGSPKIRQAEALAASMGLTVTQDNLASFLQLRDATREWSTALGGLQMQIGLALMPELSKLASAGAEFVASNRNNIIGALKSGITFAEQLGGAIFKIGSAFASAWHMIPGPMQQLLVGGFVANKALGWLFGTSPLSMGKNLLGSLLGPLLGKVPGVGAVAGAALGVTHVWVDNMPLGGLGGGLPGVGAAAGAAGGIGAATLLGGAALTAGAAAAVGATYLVVKGGLDKQSDAITGAIDKQTKDSSTSLQSLAQSYLAATHGQQQLNSNLFTQFGGLIFGTNTKLDTNISDLATALTARGVKLDPATLQALANGTAPGATSSTAPTRNLGLVARVLQDMLTGKGKTNFGAFLPSAENILSLFKSSSAPSISSMQSFAHTIAQAITRAKSQGDTAAVRELQDIAKALQTLIPKPGSPVPESQLRSYMNSPAYQNYRAGERDLNAPKVSDVSAQTQTLVERLASRDDVRSVTTATNTGLGIVRGGLDDVVSAIRGITVNVNVSAKQNDYSTNIQNRYGPPNNHARPMPI